MPKGRESEYVDTGASIEDALMDLSDEDFHALMAELGKKLQGPKEAPIKKVGTDAASDEAILGRIDEIKARIRRLVGQGYKLNPATASPFTLNEMLQKRMNSYGEGAGAGTGNSAELLSEMIRKGNL